MQLPADDPKLFRKRVSRQEDSKSVGSITLVY